MEFQAWAKTARLSSPVTITEKIDGTNAAVVISSTPFPEAFTTVGIDYDVIAYVGAQSRNRFITPAGDNYGFARWVAENADQLAHLGPGRHFGEWWGLGIQRGYGQTTKRFSLFDARRYKGDHPACVGQVPTIATGDFTPDLLEWAIKQLADGSIAAPGFDRPEGLVIRFSHNNVVFKHILDK